MGFLCTKISLPYKFVVPRSYQAIVKNGREHHRITMHYNPDLPKVYREGHEYKFNFGVEKVDILEFCIVKYAGDTHKYYWEHDPKETGVSEEASAHDTYTGKQVGILPKYRYLDEALEAAAKMNAYNPSGDYVPCRIWVKNTT